MADSVPAWKKLGLKVQQHTRHDPLTVASPSAEKRKHQDDTHSHDGEQDKKPPKRKKLPKAERPPPPEADQLRYLRQYHEDRQQWKFSKQKQNWILKNAFCVETVAPKYDHALHAYLDGLQGSSSRERLQHQAAAIIDQWNEFMTAKNDPVQNDGHETGNETQGSNTDPAKDHEQQQQPQQQEPGANKQKAAPEEAGAKRAQLIYKALTGELKKLELVDEFETDNNNKSALSQCEDPAPAAQDLESGAHITNRSSTGDMEINGQHSQNESDEDVPQGKSDKGKKKKKESKEKSRKSSKDKSSKDKSGKEKKEKRKKAKKEEKESKQES